jgi:glutathione S-transferase
MFEGAEPNPARYTKLEEAYQIFDKLLEGQTWAAGDHLTIADFALVVTVSNVEVSTNSFCSRPTGESRQRCHYLIIPGANWT